MFRIIFLYHLLYKSLIFSEEITGNPQISSLVTHVHTHAALRKSQSDNTPPRLKQPSDEGCLTCLHAVNLCKLGCLALTPHKSLRAPHLLHQSHQ